MRSARTCLAALAAVALVTAVAAAPAWGIALDDRAIYIEINDTDGDAGIQIFLDGEGWDEMTVLNPIGEPVMFVVADGSVAAQGITELFLESAEPSFDEQPLEELLELFPEGIYRFRGMTTEGQRLVGSARLTHALPDAPEIILPEEEDEEVDPADTVVEWLPVDDPPGSRIVGYEVVVEKDEGQLRVFKADMGPNATRVTVPPEFMLPGTAYKAEVLAIERSGNRTISEIEFETE